MDKDRHAVKLLLEDEAREAILGVFGDSDFDQMMGKMFTILDMADNLRIQDMRVEVTIKQLKAARKKYLEGQMIHDDE
jgi:hypothetical protein